MRLGSLSHSGGGLWIPTRQRRTLILPNTTNIITLLVPDQLHTSVDESNKVQRVTATLGADSQVQSDAAKRFQWDSSSAMGGRAAMEKLSATTPYLLTAAGLALSQPFVVYAVCCPPIDTSGATLIVDGTSGTARAYIGRIGADTWQIGGSSGTINGTHTMAAVGALFTGVYDGSSSEFLINNVSKGTGTITTAAALDYFTWGSRFSFTNPWGGLHGLLCVQSGHPSGANISANNVAIMNWFGLS